jgi:hypothetical protein
VIIAFISSANGLDFVTAEWQGKTFEVRDRYGVEFALCRQLVAAGISDMPMAVLPRSGEAEQMRLPSIHRAAKKTIVAGEHGETLADYREGPAARRTSKPLDVAAVSFAGLADCVLAADAATSVLTLARHGLRRKISTTVLPTGMGSAVGDRPGRSASGWNMTNMTAGVL